MSVGTCMDGAVEPQGNGQAVGLDAGRLHT